MTSHSANDPGSLNITPLVEVPRGELHYERNTADCTVLYGDCWPFRRRWTARRAGDNFNEAEESTKTAPKSWLVGGWS